MKSGKKIEFAPYCYLVPSMLIFAVFLFYPFFKTIYLSLFMTNKMGQAKLFVGLQNYIDLLNSKSFQNSLKVTVVMLHPTVGIVNKLLGLDINWLNDPRTTLYCVAILTAWLNSGINFLYFSAGLGNIDETIYERASVDGASGVQQFFHLTLPGLSPIMFYTVVVNIIQAFQSFGQIKILTEGGPNESTNVIVYSIYRDAFFNYRFGSASAQSVILFIIIMLVTLVMFRMERKGVNY